MHFFCLAAIGVVCSAGPGLLCPSNDHQVVGHTHTLVLHLFIDPSSLDLQSWLVCWPNSHTIATWWLKTSNLMTVKRLKVTTARAAGCLLYLRPPYNLSIHFSGPPFILASCRKESFYPILPRIRLFRCLRARVSWLVCFSVIFRTTLSCSPLSSLKRRKRASSSAGLSLLSSASILSSKFIHPQTTLVRLPLHGKCESVSQKNSEIFSLAVS